MTSELFKVHRLNVSGMEIAKEMAEEFQKLTDWLSTRCQDGREWALVKTKLEEASFFAKKAMAIDPRNQEK